MKKLIITLAAIAAVALVIYAIHSWNAGKLMRNPALTCGNGRIEATEINIAARLPGKVELVKVMEGDKVVAGQPLVIMQTNVLVANLAQAEAKRAQAVAAEASAKAKISVQEANLSKAKADLERKVVIERNALSQYKRYQSLLASNATSQHQYETMETAWFSAKANLAAAQAAVKEAKANLQMAKADLLGAQANILAAEAEMASIKEDISDSILKAPLAGRVQYRVAEPGEVLSAGGRALNMIDLTDVYMTFFLPEETVGKVRIGSEVRIVLDAVPNYPLPARVAYVASTAQFTPKTVETRLERQKLMFRVKAYVDRALLEQYIDIVKTGLPGVAWVKLDDKAPWPKELTVSPEAQKKADAVRARIAGTQLTPRAVMTSETSKRVKNNAIDENAAKKQLKGLTQTEAKNIGAKIIKKVHAARKGELEEAVSKAKVLSKQQQAAVNKQAQAAKAADKSAQQKIVGGGEKK